MGSFPISRTRGSGPAPRRERLRVNENPPPDWWSDAQRADSLAAFLAAPERPKDIWVFGYGSLLWNRSFQPVERRVGILRGYRRRFCMVIKRIRGSEEAPGLMLALDRGGQCGGAAFRLDNATAHADLQELWRREMLSNIYTPRWKKIAAPPGTSTSTTPMVALAFIANRQHPRYAPQSDAEAAAMIARAAGSAGTCADYLFETAAQLTALGIRDRHVDTLVTLVRNSRSTDVGGDS